MPKPAAPHRTCRRLWRARVRYCAGGVVLLHPGKGSTDTWVDPDGSVFVTVEMPSATWTAKPDDLLIVAGPAIEHTAMLRVVTPRYDGMLDCELIAGELPGPLPLVRVLMASGLFAARPARTSAPLP